MKLKTNTQFGGTEQTEDGFSKKTYEIDNFLGGEECQSEKRQGKQLR